MDDDEVRPRPVAHEVGMNLDRLSVDELRERIEVLRGEIGRLETEIEEKMSSKTDADSVFKI